MSLSEVSEVRRCNRCKYEWEDEGEEKCPRCGSEDTEVVRSD
jgi:rubrerythrin